MVILKYLKLIFQRIKIMTQLTLRYNTNSSENNNSFCECHQKNNKSQNNQEKRKILKKRKKIRYLG